MIVTISN